ncbi:MAG: cupin domain-containing protein [Candidatus Pelethousia sp.]|nr:cupin domain-containing protein [Candidatus Pelethousia sp.]
MKVRRKGTGETYTPLSHYGMTTQVIFNPESGSSHANVTLSTVSKGAGSLDEVHAHSDQIFCVLQGEMRVSAEGKLLHLLHAGDAILVEAGDVHAVTNEGDEDCVYYAITVPPLDKTH